MMPGSGVARALMILVLVFVVLGLVLAMAGMPYTPS